MKKMNNKRGFTLAELLIVVAIIAVLVAVSIPIFTAQLRNSRLATNQANARAAYAMAVAKELESDVTAAASYTYTVKTGALVKDGTVATKSISTAITEWDVDTTVNSKKLGDAVAETWTVIMTATGTLDGFTATYPTT